MKERFSDRRYRKEDYLGPLATFHFLKKHFRLFQKW